MERAAKFKAILSIKVGLIGLALQAALASIVIPPSHAETFRLSEATVSDINAAMDAGALTSEGLVQLYLNRINAYDAQGPSINALIMVNPNALEEARALDLERQTSGPRSPLHGIPIILKDNYDTADLPTTAGLPLGLSFMAAAYSEPKLLWFAYAYEQASQLSQPPQTTPPVSGERFEY